MDDAVDGGKVRQVRQSIVEAAEWVQAWRNHSQQAN